MPPQTMTIAMTTQSDVGLSTNLKKYKSCLNRKIWSQRNIVLKILENCTFPHMPRPMTWCLHERPPTSKISQQQNRDSQMHTNEGYEKWNRDAKQVKSR